MSDSSSDEALRRKGSSISFPALIHLPESDEDDDDEKRVQFAKVFSKEFSSLDPSQALEKTPEFTIKDIANSTGSTNSVASLETTPEFLIEASVGIIAQTAASELADYLQM